MPMVIFTRQPVARPAALQERFSVGHRGEGEIGHILEAGYDALHCDDHLGARRRTHIPPRRISGQWRVWIEDERAHIILA